MTFFLFREKDMRSTSRLTHAAFFYGLALLVGGSMSAPRIATAQSSVTPRLNATETKTGAPRLSDGRPDLQGVWNFASATPMERPAQFADKPVLTDAEAEAFLKNLPSGGCRFVKCDGSDDGKLESAYDDAWYEAGFEARRQSHVTDRRSAGRQNSAAHAAGRAKRSPQRERSIVARAFLDGPEGATVVGPMPHRLQFGAADESKRLQQHGADLPDLEPCCHLQRDDPQRADYSARWSTASQCRASAQWAGDSRGRWEGDTLVVETTNLRADTGGSSPILKHCGSSSGSRASAPTGCRIEYTMNDARTWTKPWTVRVPMTKSADAIFEYACHEGNYSMPNRLSAARANDAKTKK